MLTVRYFAAARELSGRSEEELGLERAPVSQDAFRELLAARHPRLAPHLPRMRLAINGELVGPDVPVGPSDEVDLLPPVAGGSGGVVLSAVRAGPLSIDECVAAVSHAGAGGIAVFLGVVRDHAEGKPVARLDYEAHGTLAEKEMRRVLESVLADVPGCRLAVTHRTGELAVGDAAVVVAASAPHRAEAFRACRAAIDRIKETVPIWKKEWAPDGSANWVNLTE